MITTADEPLPRWVRRHKDYPNESRWQIRDSDDGELIARIVKRPYGSKDIGDANGDLIASAPELVSALADITMHEAASGRATDSLAEVRMIAAHAVSAISK